MTLCVRLRIFFAALLLLFVDCAHQRPCVETLVRRVDSQADIATVGTELGAQGWRIVDVAPLQGGWAFVVTLEREVRP